MTVGVNVAATDEVVREMAEHPQTWADELGFNSYGTYQGGFLRIKFCD